jgi:flagellar basal body P-ring formation chaperone FlgA
MRNWLCQRIRALLCGVATVCFPGAVAISAFASACALTVPSEVANEGRLPTALADEGYRITGVRWDPVLKQRWVLAVHCDHPEQPARAIPLDKSHADVALVRKNQEEITADLVTVPLLVHAGETVQLWRQEDNLRITVAGVSEENAGFGRGVRVHLLRTNAGEGQERQLFGIVRGPGIVEIGR